MILSDLDEAITAQQQAVRLTPDGHPRKPACLSNLGISFRGRFKRLGDVADLDEAITTQQQASVSPRTVTLTSLHVSITSDCPSKVGLSAGRHC